MAEIYWIRHKDHTDFTFEGYIGYTSKTTDFRFRQHLTAAQRDSRYPIHSALRKYGEDIVVQTLVVGDEDYCLGVEYKLRPEPNIGWNLAVGGAAPLLCREYTEEFISALVERNKKGLSEESRKKISESRKGFKHSEETKALYSETRKADGNAFYGKSHSDETKEALSKAAYERLASPWKHPCANLEVWSKADKIWSIFQEDSTVKSPKLEKLAGLTKNKLLAMHAKLKTGWNPLQDEQWLAFKSQYEKETHGT